MDTAEAKNTHATVRNNLNEFALTNIATLQMYAISGDTCCKLGEWLQLERRAGRHLDLHQVHRDFHDKAGRIMRLLSSKQFEAADHMMGEFISIETKLLTMLGELE